MSAPFTVTACVACGHAVFPPRLACPQCHATAWREVAAESGVVEHVTTVRRSAVIDTSTGELRLGVVRVDRGPLVLARLDAGAQPGSKVTLTADGNVVLAGEA